MTLAERQRANIFLPILIIIMFICDKSRVVVSVAARAQDYGVRNNPVRGETKQLTK